MQGAKTENDNNVVSIFAQRDAAKDKAQKTTSNESSDFFTAVMERNAKNAERMRRERLQANKSVLRSYRIKH